MNDPYASFTQAPQTNAVMSTPSVPVTQPTAAATPQTSATDRLEMLLKQLQEERVSEPVVPAVQPAATAGQDFVSALSRVPAPAPQTKPDLETPTPLSSLDGVIKTIGEQFEMGQPSLSELLQLAKQSAETTTSAPALTPASSNSPMQFTRPQGNMPQAFAAAPSAAPKITVMPPATEAVKPMMDASVPTMSAVAAAPVIPNFAAAPEAMNTAEVPSALAPTPAPATTPVTSAAEEAPKPRRRVLTQYLQNLASHMQQHGQLNLPSYSKLTVAR